MTTAYAPTSPTFEALRSIPGASVQRAKQSDPVLAIVERDGYRAILSLRADQLALVMVKRTTAAQRSGTATRLLHDIIAVADLCALRMTLVVAPPRERSEPHLSRDELHAWYGRLGFVRDGASAFCYRPPRRIAAAS